MSQLYDKAAVSIEDRLVDDLGDWIDQYNIARLIVESIKDEWGTVTYGMCQDLWYRALDQLPSLILDVARWLPDPGEED